MALTTIVAATDFSETSQAAVDWAATLAARLGAKLVVAHVYSVPILGLPDASVLVDAVTAVKLSEIAQTALDREVARVAVACPGVEGALREGDARDVVPSLATSLDAGLLVIGSHGRRGIARALLGSVAESIVRASHIPVTVVRT
jgi:nucleotide-binding universal stress UspA family protein